MGEFIEHRSFFVVNMTAAPAPPGNKSVGRPSFLNPSYAFQRVFILVVTTPVSLLNNMYFRNFAVFFSQDYTLLLIFLLFFFKSLLSLKFPYFFSCFFLNLRAPGGAHAHTRMSACC